jgi:hypothetical protein
MRQSDLRVLRKQIQQDARRAPRGVKEAFCKAWPDAKKALQRLADLLKNPIAKGVIAIVISLGDVAYDAIC